MTRMPEPKAPADPVDVRLVRRLAAILNDTGLTEIEVERGDLRIKVARKVTQTATYAPAMAPATAPTTAPATASSAAASDDAEREGDLVNSPMVGTVYLQPQPGSPPFIRV